MVVLRYVIRFNWVLYPLVSWSFTALLLPLQQHPPKQFCQLQKSNYPFQFSLRKQGKYAPISFPPAVFPEDSEYVTLSANALNRYLLCNFNIMLSLLNVNVDPEPRPTVLDFTKILNFSAMVNFIFCLFSSFWWDLISHWVIFRSPTKVSKIKIVKSNSIPSLQNHQILSSHRNKTVKGRFHIQTSY